MDDQERRPGPDPLATPDERGVASAIYGLVVCSATLAAASASGRLSFVAVSVLVTVVVSLHRGRLVTVLDLPCPA
ncbi:MAG: hypothetical protein ABI903_14445 [Actinomycetota bacterium]